MSKSQPSPGNLIRSLLNGLPEGTRERRLLIMLQGYVDDSGSDGVRPPFVLAAYMTEAEKWEAFSNEWKSELDRQPKIVYFKMKEAASGEGQFFGVPLEFRKYKVRNLLEIVKKYGLDGIHTHVLWEDYRAHLEPHLPNTINAYGMLFFGIMDTLRTYQVQKKIFPQKTELAFDEQGSVGQLAVMFYSLIKQFKKMPPEFEEMLSGTPRMLDDIEYVPLQAADMLAWALRRKFDPDTTLRDWDWLYDEIFKTIWIGTKFNSDSLKALSGIVKEAEKAAVQFFIDRKRT